MLVGDNGAPANCSTANYTYDGAGNELTSPKYTFAYNEKDQTTSVTPAGGSAVSLAYAGSAQGQRTSWNGHTYASGQLGVDKDVFTGNTVYYNHDPGGGVVGERINGSSYYYVTDGLGSVMGVFNATSSTPVNTYKYDPWGGLTSSTGTTYNQWRYAQGFADVYSTGTLMKFGTRYYDSTTMRWTQPDPMGGGYLYVGDNPVNATDPSGLLYGAQEHSTRTLGQATSGWGNRADVGDHSGAGGWSRAIGNFVASSASTVGHSVSNFFTRTVPRAAQNVGHFINENAGCFGSVVGATLKTAELIHAAGQEAAAAVVAPELTPAGAARLYITGAEALHFADLVRENC